MSKRKVKIDRRTTPDGSKAHVYLLVPIGLLDWLQERAKAEDFKNVQDKILDVLRTARESESRGQEQAVA